MKVRLWSINRWLRYTGFRVFVEVPTRGDAPKTRTSIGIAWHGLPGSPGWHRIEGTVPPGVFSGWVDSRGLSIDELEGKAHAAIEAWHTSGTREWRELHEFLGLTLGEYKAWVEQRYSLINLLELRSDA